MILGAAVLCWAAATTSVGLWAFLRSRTRGRPIAPRTTPPSWVLLRPCSGNEPRLRDALLSSRAVGPRVPVRFLLASADDPAFSVVTDVLTVLRSEGHDARVLITGARGPNRKADQLARGVDASPDTDAVIVADSDVHLTAEALASLGEAIGCGAGAAWCPPIEDAPSTSADVASAALLGASLHAFALLAALDPRGMVGKLFAVRRDALARAGGFGALVDRLGEDMELARHLRTSGARVDVTASPALSVASARRWSDVTRRYARWIAVIRAQRPALLVSYPLLFGAAPLQVVLALFATLAEPPALGLAALALAVVGRALVARLAIRRAFGGARPPAMLTWAFGMADVLVLLAFGLALLRRNTAWRGTCLRLTGDGRIVEVRS